MPIFYRSKEEREAQARLANQREELRVAKIDYKSAKTQVKVARAARKQARAEEKLQRLHAESHSRGHHAGRCGVACRLGKIAHGHRG